MSIWTCIGWLALAVLYIVVAIGLWIAGAVLQWPEWIAKAFGFGAAPLALLFALIRKYLSAPAKPLPDDPASVPAPAIAANPGMIDLLPPKEVARRWKDLLPHLAGVRAPVCLAMGEDDDVRAGLWRETPSLRYFRDEASGLGLAVLPDALWVDVPARFIAPPPPGESHPAVAGGMDGLWEELVAFLPSLPGCVAGVLILSNPDQPRDGADAASLWLAGKLEHLFARNKQGPVPVWMGISRLEDCPGGGRLLRALAGGDAQTRSLLVQPLGAIRGAGEKREDAPQSLRLCAQALSADLDRFLLGCDTAMRDSSLSRSVYLVRQNLSRLTANAEALASRLASRRKARSAPFGGLLLCGANPITDGLAFTGEATRTVIPRCPLSETGGWFRYLPLVLWAAVIAFAAGAYVLYREAGRDIEAIPFHLLDASPDEGRFGGPPPISRYALARDRIAAVKAAHPLAKRLYPAVGGKLRLADEMFVANLRSWLPGRGDPAAIDLWLDGMAAWAGTRPGVRALAFSAPSGAALATIPAAFTSAGRGRAATLLRDWRALLPEEDAPVVDNLLRLYDVRTFAAWRQGGGIMASALEKASRSVDFEDKKDLLGGSIVFSFLQIAARELAFDSAASSEWRDAVMAVHEADTAAALRGGEIGLSTLRDAGRAARGTLAGAAPLDHVDRALRAAECWRAYRDSLAAMGEACRNEAGLAALAADAFSPPPPGKEASPSLAAALARWTSFRAALVSLEPRSDSGSGREALLLTVLPFRMAFAASLTAAANAVQAEWDKTVRLPLAGMDAEQAALTLVGDKLLDAFLSGSAAPYLVVARDSIQPARAMGAAIPFSPAFLSWLNAVRPTLRRLSMDYPVRLILRPVTVNPEALIFPRGISFSMESTPDPVNVAGYNYPVSSSFVWSLPTGGDVTVKIHFDAFSLPLRFSGGMGLVKLLHSLKDGSMHFVPSDFPAFKRKLEDQCVKGIAVAMDIDAGGAERLSPDIDAVPGAIVDLPIPKMP